MAKHVDDRPHPLRHEATWKAIIMGTGAIGTVVGVEFLGALTDPMVQAVQLLTIGGSLYGGTQLTARAGEKHVTPISDPRDNDGNKLVAQVVARPEEYSI